MIETEWQGTPVPSVLAVLVLYRLAPDQSPAFTSLMRAVQDLPASPLACIVYDNSPEAHAVPATPFPCEYRHDPSNPGLASAYQYALEQAHRAGTPWLLLLDQDTVLTAEYLAELLRSAGELEQTAAVAAIVPRLLQDDVVLSPHWPYGAAQSTSFGDRSGLLEANVCVYNSGALLRVEALMASGGFPRDFLLDYLDHAVFARLRAQGRRVFLLPASLEHHLDSKAADLGADLHASSRLQGILSAESQFYREYGSRRERTLLRRRRLRLAIGMLFRLQLRSLAALVRSSVSWPVTRAWPGDK